MENKPEDKKTAAAVRYDPSSGDNAPRVVASGHGYVAEEILRVAKENHIPLRHDPALAAALADLDIGGTIPPELYKAVAEVIAFVYRLNGKAH